jgi:hypothetical protein
MLQGLSTPPAPSGNSKSWSVWLPCPAREGGERRRPSRVRKHHQCHAANTLQEGAKMHQTGVRAFRKSRLQGKRAVGAKVACRGGHWRVTVILPIGPGSALIAGLGKRRPAQGDRACLSRLRAALGRGRTPLSVTNTSANPTLPTSRVCRYTLGGLQARRRRRRRRRRCEEHTGTICCAYNGQAQRSLQRQHVCANGPDLPKSGPPFIVSLAVSVPVQTLHFPFLFWQD